jgi:hypothetical protein
MADTTISQLSLASPNKDTAIIPFSDGNSTYKTSPSGIVAASPGSVIQVKFADISTGFSTSSNTYTRVFGATITPTSTTSRILITASVLMCSQSWNGGPSFVNLSRNTTELTYQRPNNWANSPGNTNGNMYNVVLQHLDSSANTTSPIDYNVCVASNTAGYLTTVNILADGNNVVNGISTITLMEIAG